MIGSYRSFNLGISFYLRLRMIVVFSLDQEVAFLRVYLRLHAQMGG